jgi:LPXTG-motif cell wall-anchored protein
MLKRIAAIAGAVVVLVAVPAAAEQYPPGENALTVSDATPCPGDTVTITAKTFTPGTQVELSFDTTRLGSPVAGADGTVTLQATVPEGTQTGPHIFTAIGAGIEEADLHLTSNVEVVACEGGTAATAARSGGGGLPTTGSDTTMTLVRIGLALAALGGVILAVTTKRRRTAARQATA